jgi:uncharacterized protein YkwD
MMKRLALLLLFVAAPAFATDITKASVVTAMNEQRAQFGLRPLHEDPRLDAAAADRMRDMEELSYWGHESPDGRSPFFWMQPHQYIYRFAGENLATGFETAELLVGGWMESKGHRDNILSPDYEDCGIAIIDGGTVRRVTGKSVVVMFGTAQETHP